MRTNRYTNIVLTVIAICLVLLVLRLYEFPVTAHASSNQTEVYVVGGSIEVDGGSIDANITNPRELARANYNALDGMSVYSY